MATDARGLTGGPLVSRGNTWLSSQGGFEAELPQPSAVQERGALERNPHLSRRHQPVNQKPRPLLSHRRTETWEMFL